jgi:hypothetical protein
MWHGTGEYTAEVSWGDIDEEGFDKPAFGATRDFTISDGAMTTVAITARLTNVAVTVEGTEAFLNYFRDCTVAVERGGQKIVDFTEALFTTDSDVHAAFVRPEPFTLKLSAIRRSNGEPFTKVIDVTTAAACTHYKVKYNVNNGAIGGATLDITWDDEVISVTPIEIEVGEGE